MHMIKQLLFYIIVLAYCKMASAVQLSALPVEHGASLTPHVQVLLDPQKKLLAADLFNPTHHHSFVKPKKSLTYGYYSGAVWLSFELASEKAQSLILNVQPSFLDDIRLYHFTDKGSIAELNSGDHIAVNQREFKNRHMLLPINLQAGNNQFLMRIETSSAFFVLADLWQPEALTEHLQTINLLYGIVFGLTLLGIVIALICWLWRRQSLFVIAALFISAIGLLNFTLKGFDQVYWYPNSGYWPDHIVGVASFFMGAIIQRFVNCYLLLGRHYPRLSKVVSASEYLWWLGGLASLLGYYPTIVSFAIHYGNLIVISVLIISLVMLKKERQRATLALLTFGANQIALLLMILVNIGGIPSGNWTLHIYPAAAIMQVSFTIFVVLSKLREDERRAQLDIKESQAQKHFYNMMAHELRTPLAVVNSAITNLQLTLNGNQQSQARFTRINAALARLNFLLDNALAENRLSQIEIAPMEESQHLSDFINNIQALMPVSEAHPLSIILPEQSIYFSANQQWLTLAILNLLDNAIKYSPQGGKVELNITVSQQLIRFSVFDSGIGVAETDSQKLFNKHFRSQQMQNTHQISGVGLGLYLVAQVARHHHGSFGYQPTDKGSCFYLEFPLNSAKPNNK
ncbi:sensor histidine kinase [Catenovulum sediminis]|uniref:histidine kinase n=1 Tax=Catenovulum sediminis TaxID=1740262 RepID=A0ABV1RFM8_9ALTE